MNIARGTAGIRTRWVWVLGIVVIAVAGVVIPQLLRSHAAAATAQQPGPSMPGEQIRVNDNACGREWTGGRTGTRDFAIWNGGNGGTEVYLEDTDTHKIALEVENLGSGATTPATVVLGPGHYRFLCYPDDGSETYGPVAAVTGPTPADVTSELSPVTEGDIIPVVTRYQQWLRAQLPTLDAHVRSLLGDVQQGDVAAAEQDWLRAHLTYETLGGAYDAFGAEGDAIDGLPSSTISAAHDPHLHGFHKIEALLWGGAPTSSIVGPCQQLVTAVHRLAADLKPQQAVSVIDMGLRPHEILEDTLRFTLTGLDDAGSHTSLATVSANVTGTLAALRPWGATLSSRDPYLKQTYAALRTLQRTLTQHRHNGVWTPLLALPAYQREVLDAHVSQAVEDLSHVAMITEPRKSLDE